jgi:hypothetical protein
MPPVRALSRFEQWGLSKWEVHQCSALPSRVPLSTLAFPRRTTIGSEFFPEFTPKEIRAKLKGFMKTDGWSTDYARSLTKDQWTGELERRFFDDIRREITSLAVREPVRLALRQHSLEPLGDNEHSLWKIYNVSISGEISLLFVTAYFWQVAPPWQDIGVEPILPGYDENTFSITVQAVLRIDNEGRLSSEVIDVSLDPESLGPSEEWYTDDFILALIE